MVAFMRGNGDAKLEGEREGKDSKVMTFECPSIPMPQRNRKEGRERLKRMHEQK